MNLPKKILLIGPFPDPISGVSLANKVVKEGLVKSNLYKVTTINTSYPFFDENIGGFSLKKLFFYLTINVSFLKVITHKIIYLTPGQTFFGVTKYTLYILLGALLKKELVIHVHGNHLGDEYSSLKGLKKLFFRFLLSKFTKGIVLSSSLKKNLSPFLSDENIYVLPNFAQNYLITKPATTDFSIINFVYLSNLMEEKGILFFLKALIILEEKGVVYQAKIAGNIDRLLSDKINNVLSKLKYTRYIGVVSGKEKKELLEWSTVFVLPTYYSMEGQPISILEAMATNNTIVTTAHAGIPEIMKQPENGFFVKKKNVESLLKQLLYLSKNKEEIKKIALRNKEYFLQNFTEKKFIEKFIKIITK